MKNLNLSFMSSLSSLKKPFVFAAFVVSCVAMLSACQYTVKDGPYAEVAKCLTDKGVKFYGAWWCPHCADQKKILGDDMRYINYVECDKNGKNANPQACADAGVKGYPTWFFPGQENVQGVLQPQELATKANCPLPAQPSDTAAPETNTEKPASTDTENSSPAPAAE